MPSDDREHSTWFSCLFLRGLTKVSLEYHIVPLDANVRLMRDEPQLRIECIEH